MQVGLNDARRKPFAWQKRARTPVLMTAIQDADETRLTPPSVRRRKSLERGEAISERRSFHIT